MSVTDLAKALGQEVVEQVRPHAAPVLLGRERGGKGWRKEGGSQDWRVSSERGNPCCSVETSLGVV